MTLSSRHEAYLIDRAVDLAVATERGYQSASPTKADLRRLGYPDSVLNKLENAEGLLIPRWPLGRKVEGIQYRPDNPKPEVELGKFLAPKGQLNRLDVHPRHAGLLADPRVPIWVTEGYPKADALTSLGLVAVCLAGVWGWRGLNGKGGRTALADFHDIAWDDREVIIAYDADVMAKLTVESALIELRGYLDNHGADVAQCYLPFGPHGENQGVDDFIASKLAEGLDRDKVRDLLRGLVDPVLHKASIASSKHTPTGAIDRHRLAIVLDAIEVELRKYVWFANDEIQVPAVALWIACTYLIDQLDVAPYLHVHSPARECGKTRLVEVCEGLVRVPWEVVTVTPATLFRKLNNDHPTLLWDEVDRSLSGREGEQGDLIAVLNSGTRRGKLIPRVLDPKKSTIAEFDSFGPKLIAGIAATKLPDTTSSRCIHIGLQRKPRGQKTSDFYYSGKNSDMKRLQTMVAPSIEDALADLILEDWLPRRVEEKAFDFLSDRAWETWLPLLAIAKAAGGPWWRKAVRSAVTLSGTGTFDPDAEDKAVRLLWDVRAVWPADEEDVIAVKLYEALRNLDGAPWAEEWSGLTDIVIGRRFRKLLKEFGLPSSRKFRTLTGDEVKGWNRDVFDPMFGRYLPDAVFAPGGIPGDSSVPSVPNAPTRGNAGTDNLSEETSGKVSVPVKGLVKGLGTDGTDKQAVRPPEGNIMEADSEEEEYG